MANDLDTVKMTLKISDSKLTNIVASRKEELPTILEDFLKNNRTVKFDKYGNEEDTTNPYLISTFFFKPINPMLNIEPIYSVEQLSLVYGLYSYLIEQINLSGMTFQPTLSHFCKFIGITVTKFKEYKASGDKTMRDLAEQINTDIFDANIMLAQHGRLTGKMTEYRMKVENEMLEKKNPNVNVNVSAKTIDLDKINSRLYEINHLGNKQIDYEGK